MLHSSVGSSGWLLNMFQKNTKYYGNMGEADAISRFCKAGIPIYLPFGDNEPADMIVKINEKFIQIQCKTTYMDDETGATFYLQSCSTNYLHTYSQSEVDYFYLYAVNADRAFLLKNTGDLKTIKIRFIQPKNRQVAGINMFNDYEFDTVISKLLISN